MLLSMTGHGQATSRHKGIQVSAEIRSVNSRFLKVTIFGDLSAALQSRVEELIRSKINRGTLTIRIRTDHHDDPSQFQLNEFAIQRYRDQLVRLAPQETVPLSALILLPGVCDERIAEADDDLWPIVQPAVIQALERLNTMRAAEGQSMQANLVENSRQLLAWVAEVEQMSPQIVEAYANRLTDRIQQLLERHSLSAAPVDVIREVGIMAERFDVSEEVVRLRSHVLQFEATMQQPESNGRKLEFLIQEILRETNTIGSKVNHAKIAQHVVEMKTAIERIREMIQNIE